MELTSTTGVFHSQLKNVFVTCLKFHGSYLWAGQAGDIHVFDLSEKDFFTCPKRICSREVFSSQNIHGIVFNDSNVLVFGGKRVAVLEKDISSKRLSLLTEWTVEDWLLDGLWLEDSSVVLLTSHNLLLHYTVSPHPLLKGRIAASERSILYIYSGKLYGSSWEELVVFGGTVYQEVIIWTPSSASEANTELHILHRLQGHKGVIFSISYDPISGRITSTSDDRSVRVWIVRFPELPGGGAQAWTGAQAWAGAQICLSFSAFGHSARVWRAVFSPGHSSSDLFTIGEDCALCLWSGEGRLMGRWEHPGELWSLDISRELCLTAAGGNGIVLRSIEPFTQLTSLNISEFGNPKQAVLSSEGHSVISTDTGCLLQQTDSTVTSISRDVRFSSYSLLSVSPTRDLIAIGSIRGDILIYLAHKGIISKGFEVNVGNGRIYSLTWASSCDIVTCSENGAISLIRTKDKNGSLLAEVSHRFVLPASKERWINCSCFVDGFLIIGDRMGSLHLYSTTSSSAKDPMFSYLKLHGANGVTDLKAMSDGLVYSTGRDGTLRELQLLPEADVEAERRLVVVSSLKLPMDWAVSIHVSGLYGVLIAGFHDVNFVLWSVETRVSLLVLECGGGHRSFDCLIDDLNRNLILTYIRLKEVKFLSAPLKKLTHQTVLGSFHKKSINGAFILNSDVGRGTVLATAGEDNSLRLSTIRANSWTCDSTYVRHISALRVVKSSGRIVVSAGGRAQMVIWAVDSKNAGEFRLRELKSHMIRDEKTTHKISWKDAEPLTDPEMRYMDVEILENDNGTFSIFVACSDGMLREFRFDLETKEIRLLQTTDCHQGCLLRLSSFTWNSLNILVTGGTSGNVRFHSRPIVVGCSSTTSCHLTSPPHTLHQSGVNALDLLPLTPVQEGYGRLLMVTGGDDTSLVLSLFSLPSLGVETLNFSIVEHLHSCQVSGVKITGDYIVSSGVDQRVCVLSWSLEGDYLKTRLLGSYLTCVSDIHGVLTWEEAGDNNPDLNILVYGCGIQLVNFKMPVR